MVVIRVGIVGAAGYAGGELMRLLVGHEGVLLTNLVSRTHAGKSVSQVYPGYYGYDLPHFQELSADELADGCDVVFLASPSGTAWPLIKELISVNPDMKIIDIGSDLRLKDPLLYREWYGYTHKALTSRFNIVFQSINATLTSKIVRYNMGHRGNGPVSGTLYVPSLVAESNVLNLLIGKQTDFLSVYNKIKNFCGAQINVGSTSDLKNIEENTIDYIFTDPPFGGNLNYSELSFIWEAWLKVFTNQKQEAIISAVQRKGLLEYQSLMTQCFSECYRVLKPGRWMTVEFHNSQNSGTRTFAQRICSRMD
jgi:hypothetical protein